MDEKKQLIEKEDTKFIYCVAILMLIFHHLFYKNNVRTPWTSLIGTQLIETLARQCRVCVAMFCFISGYGMAKKLSCKSIRVNFVNSILFSFKHLFKFIKKYWLIVMIVNIIGFSTGIRNIVFVDLLKELVGKSNITEWWYVEQYIKMMLITPILSILACFIRNNTNKTKRVFYVLGILLLVVYIVLAIRYHLGSNYSLENLNWYRMFLRFGGGYTIVYCYSFFLSSYEIFEGKNGILLRKNVKATKSIIYISGIILTLIVRWKISENDPAWSAGDIIFAPIIIYFLVKLGKFVRKFEWMKSYINIISLISTYMWFIHPILCYYYFNKYIYSFKYVLIIFLWCVALTMVLSIIAYWIENVLFVKNISKKNNRYV